MFERVFQVQLLSLAVFIAIFSFCAVLGVMETQLALLWRGGQEDQFFDPLLMRKLELSSADQTDGTLTGVGQQQISSIQDHRCNSNWSRRETVLPPGDFFFSFVRGRRQLGPPAPLGCLSRCCIPVSEVTEGT